MKREFFNSYRKHSSYYNEYFSDFVNRNAVEWEHNKIQLQSTSSTSSVLDVAMSSQGMQDYLGDKSGNWLAG